MDTGLDLGGVFNFVTSAIFLFWIVKFVRFLWELVRVYFRNYDPLDLRTLGDWAVVTGATDGIGKEYALQLARTCRLNVVLVSRSLDKLTSLAKQIEDESGVRTKCVSVDFSGGTEIYERVKTELEELDIAVLVNNVGTNTPTSVEFLTDEPSLEALATVVRVNSTAPVLMTRIVLPGMLAKKKGAIVNLSSLSAYAKAPRLATYSATKAFVDRFSQLIKSECLALGNPGISVQTLRCAFVSTKLGRWPRLGPLVPDAESYVRSAIKTIGVADITTGWWLHELISPIFTAEMPEWMANIFMKMYERVTTEHGKKN